MSLSTTQQTNNAGAPATRKSAVPAYTLADLMTKQEFDLTRFGEKSYFVIFRDGRGNIAVGKVGSSTKLQHALHYLCDAWGYPQRDIIYPYMDVFRVIHNSRRFDNSETFDDLQLEKDGTGGDAEVVYLIERVGGC